MNRTLHLSAKAWVAGGFIVALYLLAAFSSNNPFSTLCYAAVALSTAGVVAFDSTHIHLWRYKTWISYGPVGLFLACALFWPVVVVWYFIVRVRIARGTMPLRDEFAARHGAV
jgi:hypothetical protein